MHKNMPKYSKEIPKWHLFLLKCPHLNLMKPPCLGHHLLGKGGAKKWGTPVFKQGALPHHNALSTYDMSSGCPCPGSDFVPI